jgi:very-short-patch-repair endonuclease
MPIRNIVIGQKVSPDKIVLARELRTHPTPQEARLWQRIRRNQLNGSHFRRQQIIGGFVVDFYCHAAGLVIELDGKVHLREGEYDHERDALLKQLGMRVLRFKNEEVDRDIEGVLEKIIQELRT